MSKIRLFAMDVDGTMTDGKIYMGASQELMKAFCIKDGQGIKLLQAADIEVAIITARQSDIVDNRARELGINEVYQGKGDKVSVLKHLLEKYQLTPEDTAYIGDDLGDLEAIRFCSVSFCPSDAVDAVKKEVTYILKNQGGNGAVREAAEYILQFNS